MLIDNNNNNMFLYPTDVPEIKSIVRDFLTSKSSVKMTAVIDKMCPIM